MLPGNKQQKSDDLFFVVVFIFFYFQGFPHFVKEADKESFLISLAQTFFF